MLKPLLIPSSTFHLLAVDALEVLRWALHTALTLLKGFVAVECCFAVVLVFIVCVSRIGRASTKLRQPLLSAKSAL